MALRIYTKIFCLIFNQIASFVLTLSILLQTKFKTLNFRQLPGAIIVILSHILLLQIILSPRKSIFSTISSVFEDFKISFDMFKVMFVSFCIRHKITTNFLLKFCFHFVHFSYHISIEI